MATATAAAKKDIKEFTFSWTGTDKADKTMRGEMRAGGEAFVNAMLRRQGIKVLRVKKVKMGGVAPLATRTSPFSRASSQP